MDTPVVKEYVRIGDALLDKGIITEEDLANILSEEDEELEEAADGGPIGDAAYTDAEDEDDTALKTSAATNQDAEMMPENLDSLVDSIVEKLTVDMGAELSGWAGRPATQLKDEQARALAGAQTDRKPVDRMQPR